MEALGQRRQSYLEYQNVLCLNVLLLDKKYTILSSTADLLDKIDYLCSLIRLRNEKYNPIR